MIKCPNCNNSYDNKFKFCPHCGLKAPEPKICHQCGFESYDFNFCPECGNKLTRSPKIELTNPDELIKKIKELKETNQYNELIECYDKLIELEPDNSKHHTNKSWSLGFYLEQWKEAVTHIDKAIKLEPKNAEYYSRKSIVSWILPRTSRRIISLHK